LCGDGSVTGTENCLLQKARFKLQSENVLHFLFKRMSLHTVCSGHLPCVLLLEFFSVHHLIILLVYLLPQLVQSILPAHQAGCFRS